MLTPPFIVCIDILPSPINIVCSYEDGFPMYQRHRHQCPCLSRVPADEIPYSILLAERAHPQLSQLGLNQLDKQIACHINLH